MDVPGQCRLNLTQDALLEDVLVAQEDLRQQRLQARVVTYHSDEGEAAA